MQLNVDEVPALHKGIGISSKYEQSKGVKHKLFALQHPPHYTKLGIY